MRPGPASSRAPAIETSASCRLRRAAPATRLWALPSAVSRRSRRRPHPASVSQAVCIAIDQAPPGPSRTASRSPPQPAAAAVAAVSATPPSAARSRAGARRTCPGAGRSSPDPSRWSQIGRHRDLTGASAAAYLSDAGSARSTGACAYRRRRRRAIGPACGRDVVEPVVYGNSRAHAGWRGARLNAAPARPGRAGREELEQVGRARFAGRPLGHGQRRVAFIDGLPGKDLVALVDDPFEVLEHR